MIRAAGIQMSLYPQESNRGATWGERGLSSRRFSAQIIQPTFSPAKRVTIPAMKERQTVSDLFQCVIINEDGLFRLLHKHMAQHIGIAVSYCAADHPAFKREGSFRFQLFKVAEADSQHIRRFTLIDHLRHNYR